MRSLKADIAKPLEAICSKAMNQNPSDRYQTADLMGKDLELWLADEPVSAYREPWVVRVRRFSRRNRTMVASVVSSMLALVLVEQLADFGFSVSRKTTSGRIKCDENMKQRQDVEVCACEVTDLQIDAHWKEAEAVLAETRNRLGESGPDDLRQRILQHQLDLTLVAQLDSIRQKRATIDGGFFLIESRTTITRRPFRKPALPFRGG